MQPINSNEDFINTYKASRTLRKSFNLDYITNDFDPKEDLDAYLCALAYGAVGLEIYDDVKIRNSITAQQLKNQTFSEAMLKYSILTKIEKAKGILNSAKFKKTGTVDFLKEHEANDYASIYFITYYLRTQGYVVNINPNHNTTYPPFELDFSGNLSFKKGRAVSHKRILKSVAETLKNKETTREL